MLINETNGLIERKNEIIDRINEFVSRRNQTRQNRNIELDKLSDIHNEIIKKAKENKEEDLNRIRNEYNILIDNFQIQIDSLTKKLNNM